MPTSGGGGHGGFGGGGSFHSSSGGGYYGGRGPHFSAFWFFAPHYYYRGGIGVLFAPVACLVIIFALIAVLLFAMTGVRNSVAYSEESAEEYALKQYETVFANEAGYEDKVLLVFFTYENHVDYDYIAMVGDDLTNSVYNSLRGDDDSGLSRIMKRDISKIDYQTTLGRNLSSVVDDLNATIVSYGNPFRASCKDTVHVSGNSYLINQTELAIDQDMVDSSLVAFTEATGVEMVLLVEDAAEVFGYQSLVPIVIIILFLLFIAGAVIYAMVRGMKARKNHQNNSGSNGGYQTGADFDGNPKTDSFNQGDNW